MMPAWDGGSTTATIKALTVYVHTLGGGAEVIAMRPRALPPAIAPSWNGAELARRLPRRPVAVGRRARPTASGRAAPLYAPRQEDLSAKRQRHLPRASNGRCCSLRSASIISLPFVRWDRGPYAPNQAVLVDFANSRFYFFFIEIWPQEVYYFTGLLIIAAMDAVPDERASPAASGAAICARRRCGPICSTPSSAWSKATAASRCSATSRAVDASSRASAKAGKHFVWLMIAWWTGGAWVLYFADAPTLV